MRIRQNGAICEFIVFSKIAFFDINYKLFMSFRYLTSVYFIDTLTTRSIFQVKFFFLRRIPFNLFTYFKILNLNEIKKDLKKSLVRINNIISIFINPFNRSIFIFLRIYLVEYFLLFYFFKSD